MLLRFWRPAAMWDRELEPVDPEAVEPTAGMMEFPPPYNPAQHKYSPLAPGSGDRKHGTGELLGAWMPYGLLVILVLLWGFKPFQALLNSVTLSVGWPLLHNQVMMMPPVVTKPTLYKAVYQLNFLSAAGTACMFATLLSALLLRMPLRPSRASCLRYAASSFCPP